MARVHLLCALITTTFAISSYAQMGAVQNDGFSPMYPRFVFNAGTPLHLGRRQGGNVDCPPGQHSCRAVNITGCCDNTNYCYVNSTGAGKCCEDTTTCDDNPCPLSQYHCTISSTVTCCNRACPINAFQCASTLGNNCCSIGSACVQNNLCSSTPDPNASTTLSAIQTPSFSGCKVGQTSCAATIGGGCCSSGDVCTSVGAQLICGATGSSSSFTTRSGGATNTGAATSATTSLNAGGGSSLSAGAKAGIGIGAAIGVLALLFIAWLLIKRHRATAQGDSSASTPSRGQTAMSQFSSHGRAQSQSDYFGQRGPLSGQEEGAASAYESSPGAVPVSPQGPGDITRPVEIAEGEMNKPPIRQTEPAELPS